MRPTHTMEDNLSTKSTDLVVIIAKKNSFREISRLAFGQTTGQHGLAKLTHKINRYNFLSLYVKGANDSTSFLWFVG